MDKTQPFSERVRFYSGQLDRLDEDMDALKDEKRDIYRNAKHAGLDTTRLSMARGDRKRVSKRGEAVQDDVESYLQALLGEDPEDPVLAREKESRAYENYCDMIASGAGIEALDPGGDPDPDTPDPDAAGAVGEPMVGPAAGGRAGTVETAGAANGHDKGQHP